MSRRTLLTGYNALLQQLYQNHNGALPPDCATPTTCAKYHASYYLLHVIHTSMFQSTLACLDPRSGFRCSTLWIKPIKLSSHFNNYKSFWSPSSIIVVTSSIIVDSPSVTVSLTTEFSLSYSKSWWNWISHKQLISVILDSSQSFHDLYGFHYDTPSSIILQSQLIPWFILKSFP